MLISFSRWTRFLLFFLLLLVLFPTVLFAAEMSAPEFEIYRVRNGQTELFEAIKGKAKWSWETVSEGVQAYKIRALFELPESFRGTTVSSENPGVKVVMKNQKLLLITNQVTTSLVFSRTASEETTYEFKVIKPTSFKLAMSGCEELKLRGIFDKENLPFFAGLKCVMDARGLQLQLSYTSELNVEFSSTYDSQGKGESWKVYDLGNIEAASGELANMRLRNREQTYTLRVSTAKQEELKTITKAQFSLGLGYNALKFKSPAVTASDGKPIFVLKFLPYKLWGLLGVGVDLITTISPAKSDNSITFFQVLPYSYLRFFDSSVFKLEARGYFSMTTQSHVGSGGGFQLNQAAGGLMLAVRPMNSWWMNLEFRQDGLGSDVVKSHYAADLQFMRAAERKQSLLWGIGFQSQYIKVLESVAVENEYTNNMVYLMAKF